jgi:O-methyltransferase involved in polyketide biosynthesis
MEQISDIDSATDTSRISISAHYTGYIWYKNGLSHKQFVTPMGRAAYWALKPMNVFMQKMIGASIDTFLLQRHFVLDYLVDQAIAEGYEQIVELAAGLSSRGYLVKKSTPEHSLCRR